MGRYICRCLLASGWLSLKNGPTTRTQEMTSTGDWNSSV